MAEQSGIIPLKGTIGNITFSGVRAWENQELIPKCPMLACDVVHAFSGEWTADESTHGLAGVDQQSPFNSNFYNNDCQRMKEREPDQANGDRLKAYLNFALFDDQFKSVDGNSKVKQVKAGNIAHGGNFGIWIV